MSLEETFYAIGIITLGMILLLIVGAITIALVIKSRLQRIRGNLIYKIAKTLTTMAVTKKFLAKQRSDPPKN